MLIAILQKGFGGRKKVAKEGEKKRKEKNKNQKDGFLKNENQTIFFKNNDFPRSLFPKQYKRI
jgi:hypothetical protein